jgi:hypothetical protein
MIRRLSIIFVVIGFFGFVTLVPGFFDKVSYYYFSLVEGRTIEFGEQCYSVPGEWVIDSVESQDGRKVINLRHKNKGKFQFVSVISVAASDIPDLTKLKPIKGDNMEEQVIYKLDKLPLENTVRYISVIPSKNLLVMGREPESIEVFSLELLPIECS